MDPQVVFKNVLIASVFIALLAFAALAFRPGSVSTVGQGGGTSWGSSWGGGDDD